MSDKETKQMENKQIQRPINLNNNLPTLYIDNIIVHVRADDMYLLRFTTSLPENLAEQGRFLIDKKNFEKIIDSLCHVTNHYPEKAKES